MSKISLQPNASGTGTFTLEAPNSNTNRTLSLPDEAGTVLTNVSDIESQVKTATNATGSAPVYACRAWVNFDGTGTVAIRASGNVSSITDNGTGNFTVNFATAMEDANYCWQVNAQDQNDGMGVPTAQADPTRTITSSALPVIYNYPPNTSFFDATAITVAIFR